MIEIYIGNNGDKLDLSEDVQVLMTYELEKLQNPTIIKNNFSKTITIQGTPNNDRIFGYYYKLDRTIVDNRSGFDYNSGIYFDASKRTDFKIFCGAELVESGYMQLNNIVKRDSVIEYQITLYGGIGDFFFSLSYDSEGNEKTLADLLYNDDLDIEDEFDFTMNFETVEQAWNNINNEGNKWSQINFIPSYNGMYEDFDNDKVLVNTEGSINFDPDKKIDNTNSFSEIIKDGKYYQLLNGFSLCELGEEMTEWQMRDLRSYKQRPALRTKTFLNAICNAENNGGYDVEFDPTFFHKGNPYYEDTWIALPLLGVDENSSSDDLTIFGYNTSKINYPIPTANNLVLNYVGSSKLEIEDWTNSNGNINFYPYYGVNATLDVSCDFKIKTDSVYDRNNLWLSYWLKSQKFQWSALGVWLEAKSNGIVIGNSNCLIFSNNLYSGNNTTSFSIDSLTGNGGDIPNTPYSIITGSFVKTGKYEDDWNGDRHYGYEFVDGNDNSINNWKLNLKGLPNIKNMTIELKIARWYDSDNQITISTSPTQMLVYTPYLYDAETGNISIRTDGIYVEPLNVEGKINVSSEGKSLSNRLIKKKDLLKNQITPAALLLSYTKMFGLYFIKDPYQKKISILTRNKFFNGNIVDIDDKIDRSRDINIQPLVYDKKWYMLKNPALDSKFMTDYKSRFYNAEYGQKRLDTSYNFNLDTEDIYSGNRYQNVITVLDSSKYYRHYKNHKGYVAPPFAIEGFKYCLFSGKEVDGIEFGNSYFVDFNNTSTFTGIGGVDAMPKLCCFEEKNNKQSLKDLNVSLVFFNGMQYLQDEDGRDIMYTISDDMAEMFTINDMTPTYLYSEYEWDSNDNRICCRTNKLPMFGRYHIENNNIVESLDFGVPLETYINYNYPQEATLYNGFWKGLYEDQFSHNTRKVTANVLWDKKQGNESLRNFYYFDGSYWILNKILDYNVCENIIQNVKCEFIKVNDLSNYQNQKTYSNFNYIEIDYENCYVTNSTSNAVNYGEKYYAAVSSEYGIKNVYIEMGGKDITKSVWSAENNEIYIPKVTDDVYGYVEGYGMQSFTDIELTNNIEDGLQETSLVIDVNTDTYRLDCDTKNEKTYRRNPNSIYECGIKLESRDVKSLTVWCFIEYWDYTFRTKTVTLTPNETYYLIDENEPPIKEIRITSLSYETNQLTEDKCTVLMVNDTDYDCDGTWIYFELYDTSNNTYDGIIDIRLGAEDRSSATIAAQTNKVRRFTLSTMDFVGVYVEVMIEYWDGEENMINYLLTDEDCDMNLPIEDRAIKQITLNVMGIEQY